MYPARKLAHAEAAFRHPSSATDLAAHPGEWYQLAPAFDDELIFVDALHVTVTGRSLLSHMERLGAPGVALEVAIDHLDQFGRLGEVGSHALITTEDGVDWNAGTHDNTFVDLDAELLADGSTRPVLRGRPLLPGAPIPNAAQWTSALIPLRYGALVDSAGWELDARRQLSGTDTANTKIMLRLGEPGAWHDLVILPNPVARNGEIAVPPGPPARFAQWVVDLHYAGGGGLASDPEPSRTASLLSLALRLKLAESPWLFSSLADLCRRAAIDPLLRPAAWDGKDDVAQVRLIAELELRGRFKERMRARLVGAPGTALSGVTLHGDAHLHYWRD